MSNEVSSGLNVLKEIFAANAYVHEDGTKESVKLADASQKISLERAEEGGYRVSFMFASEIDKKRHEASFEVAEKYSDENSIVLIKEAIQVRHNNFCGC